MSCKVMLDPGDIDPVKDSPSPEYRSKLETAGVMLLVFGQNFSAIISLWRGCEMNRNFHDGSTNKAWNSHITEDGKEPSRDRTSAVFFKVVLKRIVIGGNHDNTSKPHAWHRTRFHLKFGALYAHPWLSSVWLSGPWQDVLFDNHFSM